MMDVCPISFGPSRPSLPSATPTSGTWNYTVADLTGDIDFPVLMDQTVQPLPAEIILLVDGVPKTPDSLNWFDPQTLQYAYNEVALGPVVVRFQYPQMFPNFRSVAGQPVFPVDLLLSEFP